MTPGDSSQALKIARPRARPIAGQAVLKWLRDKLQGSQYTATEPDTEDWGWFIDVEGSGANYLVGASGEPERPPSDIDWTIQIHRIRSLKDKRTGRNKMTADDPLTSLLEGFVRSDPGIRDIKVEKDA
jgi:hypothetical protein